MTSDPADLDSLDDLDDLVEQTQRRYEQFAEAQRQISRTTVTEQSASGMVRATVSHNGALVGLTLDDRTAMRHPSQVAAEVLSCVQLAQARIAEQVQAVLRETVPGDDPLVEEMVADVRNRFPEPRSAAPAPRRQDGNRTRLGQIEEE